MLITDGRVPVGVRLPSERELTDALGVSRTTVTRAYAELREHGYLVSRQGSGSVASLPATRGARGDHLLPPGASPRTRSTSPAPPRSRPGMLAAYERAVAELPAYLGGHGLLPLGAAGAARGGRRASYAARGLPTSPDQVMVVPGRPGRCRDRGPGPAQHRRPGR